MQKSKPQQQYFTRQLMDWHSNTNTRSLPWKSETDPYKIWLSEIILQQTRALQGLPYYLRFTEAYLTIKALAGAKDEEVFRIWQGLGYYNRCKNMLATARYISTELKGRFPNSHEEILQLKGIGPYTAAAIASFAYGLPHAVVDGNVYRVLARYFGIDTPIDSTEGKKEFYELAQLLLAKEDSAAYNQAIMDIGATVCTPKKPACADCPLQKRCIAFSQDMIGDLPVKSKKLQVKKRYFHYLLITDGKKLWIHKREGKDIWQSLYEPLLIESEQEMNLEELAGHPDIKKLKAKVAPVYAGKGSQKLTHQLISSQFYKMTVKQADIHVPEGGIWVPFTALNNYAFPKTIVSFLEKIFYF